MVHCEFCIADGHDDDASTDSDAWEEREASRTHSVKFSEDSGIADKDTPFVRQNTPHPKELKLKAHKLFAKEKKQMDDGGNLDTLSEEVCLCLQNIIILNKLFSTQFCKMICFECTKWRFLFWIGTHLVVIKTVIG